MKRTLRLLFIFILGISLKSLSGVLNEETVALKKPLQSVFEESSEANRIDKDLTILVGYTAVGPNSSTGSFLSAGLFLNRNNLVLLEAGSSRGFVTRYRWEYSNGTSQEFRNNVAMKQLGAHYKHFVGNSFYVRTGVDFSQVDYKYDFTSSYFNESSATYNFNGESLIANFIIGNQWQWESFTLGCDWVGYAVPVYTKVKSENVPGSDSRRLLSDFKEDKETFLTSSSAILLRFYLGASF